MKVLMILPAYNEESNIINTVKQITDYSKKLSDSFILDYIVINDGSTDSTENICRKNGIKCLSLVRNLGIGGAVQTGYMYACQNGFDVAVQFDGDGQHDINSLPQLLEPLLNNEADFVIGSRFVENSAGFQSTLIRRVGIKNLSFLIKLLCNIRVFDVTSGFRAANRKVFSFLAKNYPTDYPEPESIVLLKKNGFRILEVQANMFERTSGQSSINFGKSIYYMLKVSFAIICASIQRKEIINNEFSVKN